MTIQAVILDFDGTLVTKDITDLLCDLAGKQKESKKLNRLFHEGKLHGLESVIRRINFLRGISLEQIRGVVAQDDFLRPGARDLFSFLKANNIVSIIASGSIVPLLGIYEEKLGADYVVGSKPIVKDGHIVSISENEYSGLNFKARDSKAILDQLGIPQSSVVAIGDSPADKGIFGVSAVSIVIDPKSGAEKLADYTIHDNLSNAIPILEKLMHKNEF